MSKSELLHELYTECQGINFNESFDLVLQAKSQEEAEFIQMATDLILKQKQKKAIAENRF